MSFSNPSGLWLLLGVPALIIIYLIKSKYDDRPVASTYIWKLSSQLVKKRLPIQRIRRIVMFLLQLFMIIAAALVAAKPTVTAGDSHDYVVIVDASAGMMTCDKDGVSRFDLALQRAEKIAEGVDRGHTFSLIVAGEEAVCLVSGARSPAEAKIGIEKAKCGNGGCNIDDAVALAEEICRDFSAPEITFLTDRSYNKTEGVTVVNLNRSEWNVSFKSLASSETKTGTLFKGKLVSYNLDTPVTVGLRVDGKPIDAQLVKCLDEQETSFTFIVDELFDYDTAEVYVDVEDGLKEDNTFAYCPIKKQNSKVLLVSETPFYIENVLKAVDLGKLTVVSSIAEAGDLSGYELYIFDGETPMIYPTDGSVLVFGGGELPNGLTAIQMVDGLYRVKVSRTSTNRILKDVTFEDTVVKKCMSLIGDGRWESLLTCDGRTVMASSKGENGAKYTVISFDLHDSNMPLKSSFPILIKNIVEYSLPSMVESREMETGRDAVIHELSYGGEGYLVYPDSSEYQLDFNRGECTMPLDKVGVYQAASLLDNGEKWVESFFVHIPVAESEEGMLESITISVIPLPQAEKEQAVSFIWFWFAAAMLLLLLIEWGWYYYEQY